jgi:hypothetical protein
VVLEGEQRGPYVIGLGEKSRRYTCNPVSNIFPHDDRRDNWNDGDELVDFHESTRCGYLIPMASHDFLYHIRRGLRERWVHLFSIRW